MFKFIVIVWLICLCTRIRAEPTITSSAYGSIMNKTHNAEEAQMFKYIVIGWLICLSAYCWYNIEMQYAEQVWHGWCIKQLEVQNKWRIEDEHRTNH